jgi:uncharacterized protein YndB with AHSA1/START domain
MVRNMMRVTETFLIDKPAAEVFAVLTDPGRLPEWQRNTVEVRRSASGPLTVGERFEEVHAAMRRRNESTVEVTEYERPRVFGLRIVDGPIPFDGRWVLTEVDGGATRVEFSGELKAGGVKRLLRPFIAKQFRSHHANLRELLEGAGAAAALSVATA